MLNEASRNKHKVQTRANVICKCKKSANTNMAFCYDFFSILHLSVIGLAVMYTEMSRVN